MLVKRLASKFWLISQQQKGLLANFRECEQGVMFWEFAPKPYSVKVNYSETCIRPLRVAIFILDWSRQVKTTALQEKRLAVLHF